MHSLDRSDLTDAIASGRHLLGTAAMLVMVVVGSLRLFEFLWHRDALADITRQPGGWIGAIIVAAGSALVHELLHGFAWHTFGRVPWQSISLRPTWRVMGFVARADVALPAAAYRAPPCIKCRLARGCAIIQTSWVAEWSRTGMARRPSRRRLSGPPLPCA